MSNMKQQRDAALEACAHLAEKLTSLKQRAEKAERMEQLLTALIQQHNTGCDAACGKTTAFQYVRDSRRCDPRRDCPDCPRDWRIEI